MKKNLLLAAGLLAGVLSAQAQATVCGLAISKSGVGTVKTYTLAVPPSVPSYTFSIYPTTGVTTTGTGLVKTANYTYGGVYTLYLESPNYCTDSIWVQDTVQGQMNCAGVYGSLGVSGSGLSWSLNHYTYGNNNVPGYTSSTVYNYGDGTSGSSSSHIYASSGNYLVTATTTFSHPTYPSCNKVDTLTVRATSGSPTFNCANVNAAFTYTANSSNYHFTNATTNTNPSSATVSYMWDFGDGSAISNLANPNHGYTSPGVYCVGLTATWVSNGVMLCRDTVTHCITVAPVPPPNVINTFVNWDSTVNAAGTSLKMWLIQYDSSSQILSAVDSALIPVSTNMTFTAHDFVGQPAGSYRVKAHLLNQPSSWTTGFLPTYATNAAYWANATVINHTGATSFANILLQQGTPMTGPGFISGNILQGANKGTAVGDPMGQITVFLRNTANGVVASTETDANGTYTFTNVPIGSYNVYPEELNYATTPTQTIQITAANPRSIDNDFWRETISRKLHPMTPAAVQNVASENTIRISPNPAHDRLTIEFATAPQKGSMLQLYNLNGQLVKTLEITNAQTAQHFSLGGLAAGNYLLHIPTATGKQVSRITVQP